MSEHKLLHLNDKEAILPVKISEHQFACRISDACGVLEWFRAQGRVVLGGDVLDKCKNHTYDNWFYNYDSRLSLIVNVEHSVSKAEKYISRYMSLNGENYYVIFVLK